MYLNNIEIDLQSVRNEVAVLFTSIWHFCNIFFAASIDIKEVFQDGNVDSKTLQTVLPGIAFCSLEDEFNNQKSIGTTEVSLPPGFTKLFQLAQLIIQYLLHSQKKLTEAIKLLQTNNSGLQKVLY